MTIAYLGLGSNLGDKMHYLEEAVESLSKVPEIRQIKKSSFYETKPWGKIDQDNFINAVCQVETTLSPLKLLKVCQKIEKDLGRERHEHWGSRTIDIDILLYGDTFLKTPLLTVPHPYMLERAFVLIPLLEIVPDMTLPHTCQLLSSFLMKLDKNDVRKVPAH